MCRGRAVKSRERAIARLRFDRRALDKGLGPKGHDATMWRIAIEGLFETNLECAVSDGG